MDKPEPIPSIPRVRILTASELCRDCQACQLACSLYHEGQCHLGLARLAVTKDMARYTFDIVLCRQCASPACLEACPTGAMSLDGRGVVLIDEDECTGCGNCAASCPYGAILALGDRYLKCDLCAGRPEGPLCVALCPVGALTLAGSENEGEA